MAVTLAPTPQKQETEAEQTASPARSPRLSPRFSAARHWLAGWRDGRSGRPAVTEDAPLPVRLRLIVSQADSAVERRWLALLTETREQRVQLAGLGHEIERAVGRRELAVHDLKSIVTSGPDLVRRFGEEGMPETMIRVRRARDHERRIDELTDARDKRTNYVHMKRGQANELREALTVALESTRAEARADLTHFDGLATSYLRGALRTHPDPTALELHFGGFAVPRPDWVNLDSIEDFLSAAGAESDRA